jgi:hypothetical protein
MPLMLDDMRTEFAKFLIEDPAARFRMDAALVHVVTLAYRSGIEDGKAIGAPQAVPEWMR